VAAAAKVRGMRGRRRAHCESWRSKQKGERERERQREQARGMSYGVLGRHFRPSSRKGETGGEWTLATSSSNKQHQDYDTPPAEEQRKSRGVVRLMSRKEGPRLRLRLRLRLRVRRPRGGGAQSQDRVEYIWRERVRE